MPTLFRLCWVRFLDKQIRLHAGKLMRFILQGGYKLYFCLVPQQSANKIINIKV